MPVSRRLAALRRSKRFAAYMKARKANRFDESWFHTKPADADPVTVAKKRPKTADPLKRFTEERGGCGCDVRVMVGKVDGFDVRLVLSHDDDAAGMACHRPKGARDVLHVEPYGDLVKGSTLSRAEQARAAYMGEEYERGSMFHDSHVYFVGDHSYGNDFAELLTYARDAGLPRHAAFRSAQRETDNLGRRAWAIAKGDGDVSFYTLRATASINKTKLGSASCGGMEYDDPDVALADHAGDLIAEAVREARDAARTVARRAKRRA